MSTTNPYYDLYVDKDLGHNFIGCEERKRIRHTYGYAVPGPHNIKVVASYAPLVEMGAGTGYWAYLLQEMGVDIIPYDNRSEHFDFSDMRYWTKVRRGGPKQLKKHADRTLLLCWPPYHQDMSSKCLKFYRGDTIIYVGEEAGGCTGDHVFHNRLMEEFRLVKTIPVPQWEFARDQMEIWVRKGKQK